MDIRAMAEKEYPYILEQYQWFHRNPELSWQEYETTDRIESELKKMGLSPRRFPGHTGLTAEIRGGGASEGSRTIVLRADIDALPIQEKTGLPYASRNDGVMHACGHDSHISMLLGAARILTKLREELPGTVRLLFQAAEETCHGAEYFVEQGVLDGADAIYGSHIWRFEAPNVSVDSGPRMASCDNFRIVVRGKAAHATAPHLGADAVVAAAAVIMNLQTLASRLNNPVNPVVLTIGEIHGGLRFNILADRVEMLGTVRTLDKSFRMTMEEKIRHIVMTTAETFGTEGELEYSYYPSAVINDNEEMNRIVREAAGKIYAPEQIIHAPMSIGSEDFAYYMDRIPGFFAFIGGYNESKGRCRSSHSEYFAIEETAMIGGAALYAQVAVDFLRDCR